MPRCAECGADYADGLTTCPECHALQTFHTCERCGEDFGDSDACPACGHAREEFPCDRHPDRMARGRCVICGSSLCRECKHGDARALLCEKDSGVTVIQGWAQVYSTASEFEAQLLRENLLAEGIDTRVFSQKDNMLSVDLGELSIVRLLVPVWEYATAQTLIADRMDASGEVTFACPSCGEAYEPGAINCASCGFELGGVDR